LIWRIALCSSSSLLLPPTHFPSSSPRPEPFDIYELYDEEDEKQSKCSPLFFSFFLPLYSTLTSACRDGEDDRVKCGAFSLLFFPPLSSPPPSGRAADQADRGYLPRSRLLFVLFSLFLPSRPFTLPFKGSLWCLAPSQSTFAFFPSSLSVPPHQGAVPKH